MLFAAADGVDFCSSNGTNGSNLLGTLCILPLVWKCWSRVKVDTGAPVMLLGRGSELQHAGIAGLIKMHCYRGIPSVTCLALLIVYADLWVLSQSGWH